MFDYQINLKDSIATRLLQVIFGFYLVVTILVTLTQLIFEYNFVKEKISDEIQTLPTTFGLGLATSLWTFNDELTQNILIGMLEIPIVTGVKIEDETGKMVQAIGTILDQKGNIISFYKNGETHFESQGRTFFSDLFGKEFPLQYTDKRGSARNIGKWTVYSSSSAVIERIQYGFILIMINSFIKTMALWIIFLVFVRIILGRPLGQLTNAVNELNVDNLEHFKIDLETKGRNELKLLEEAFEAMVRKLLAAKRNYEQLNQTLEEKVQIRTQELKDALSQLEQKHSQLKETQTQLIQSEKMSSLGTLVAGVAHEINNPNNFVLNGAYNLEENLKSLKRFIFELAGDELDSEIQQVFEQKFEFLLRILRSLHEGSDRIKTIVKDLRTFSRLDEADLKKVRIVDGLRSTLSLVEANYKNKVEFETHFHADPEFVCWPAKLNQVFMNLMVNACQSVLVRAREQAEFQKGKLKLTTYVKGDFLWIEFEDNGYGMSPSVQAKIFEPFFTTKAVGEGTGLGLSISFGIVQNHQGRIDVESKEGKGTIFTLQLPLYLKLKSS